MPEKLESHIKEKMKELKHFASLREKVQTLDREARDALTSATPHTKERLQLAMESRDYKLIEKYLKQVNIPTN